VKGFKVFVLRGVGEWEVR